MFMECSLAHSHAGMDVGAIDPGAPVDAALGRARIVGGVLCARGAQQKQQAAADERKRGRGTGPGAGGGNLLGAHSTNVNRILAALQGG